MSETEELTLPTVPEPAQREPDSLYRYSTWVHVGHGADSCDQVDVEAGTSSCTDPAHFHAWCRIPNDFQDREIREHARGASARKRRQMRKDGTSANEVLEEGLEELREAADGREKAESEIIGSEWFGDYMEAVREVRDLDDPDEATGDEDNGPEPKLFASIDVDMARFQRLVQEESDPNGDEYKELATHVADYQTRVQAAVEERVVPKRARLAAQDDDTVFAELRAKRIELSGQEEFLHHFNAHGWLACSYKQQAGDPETCFRDLAHMESAAPEVLGALRDTHADLQRTAREALGN